MADVRFADIFFILLVCAITFGILHLVYRSKKKNPDHGRVSNTKNSAEDNGKLVEDD